MQHAPPAWLHWLLAVQTAWQVLSLLMQTAPFGTPVPFWQQSAVTPQVPPGGVQQVDVEVSQVWVVAQAQVPLQPSLPQEPGGQLGVHPVQEGDFPGGTQQPETQVVPPGQTPSVQVSW